MNEWQTTSEGSLADRVEFGRYDLVQKIAHGGMAEIFLATERGAPLGTPPVIVKRILPELAHDPQFLGMFVNEAQLAAQMRHPNVVRVVDFGEHRGHLYMVMEYVDGLDCWRFSRRLFPWGRNHTALAVSIMCDVLLALEYVHGMTDVNGHPLHVVHRDISPSNIYLSLDGNVKLGDFGIARIRSRRYRQTTMIPKGKFGYMAPEQVEGRPIDQRSDIFAAGVVLAEILIGKKLFSGHSQLGVLLDIRDARLDTLEQNADKVEQALLAIIRRAVSREPDGRPQTAGELRDELLAYLAARAGRPPQSELADQVRRAVELRSKSVKPDAGQEQTPLTADPFQSRAGRETDLTAMRGSFPTARPGSDPPEPTGRFPRLGGSFLGDGTPVTLETTPFSAEDHYSARLADGTTVGPTSFAHLVELIYSDKVGPETPVSVDGEVFVPAAERPELARHLPTYTPTRDLTEIETPDRRGLLEMESPSEVVLSLAVRNETGLLGCESGGRRKEVYYRDGHPVYVASNNPAELLGEFLVARSAIDRMDLEMALSLLPKYNGHLGDTLIALGMLSAVDLFNHISAQITFRFDDLLGWKRGNYEFYRGVGCRADVLEVALDPFAIVRDRLLEQASRIAPFDLLGAMSQALVTPTSAARDLSRRLMLPHDVEQIAGGLRETRKLGDWAASLKNGRSKENLARGLFVAIETGMWTSDGPQPPWREGA
ncbi:MAG: serine/threonine-protein kinase [Deltaproteobacteria bacterium]|nr:serine/threonine-protein kinase [Deltaproteobacteria bacterium]